jgi:purine-binding chemotaxis protein CheW
MDLRRRLSLSERANTRRTRILLVTSEWGEVMGLLVDEVRQVVRLGEQEVESAAVALGGDVAEYVLGVGRPQGMFIVLLDLRAIVSDHG